MDSLRACVPAQRGHRNLLLGLGGLFLGIWSWRKLQDFLRRSRLYAAVQKRLTERELFFIELREREAAESKEEKEKRLSILEYKFKELQDALQTGKVSAVEVLHAYQHRALEIQERTNCITEFVTEAEDWAQALDSSPADPRPPLFGIPFSVKESIAMEKYDSTRGYAQELNDPAKKTAAIVAVLKEAGAIPFVRTNVPQSLLSFSCSNPIFGRTLNPFDPSRTCGGSSGGEGALIALGGAPFGLGSDVGGSIRMPAHFSGCAGIKPSHLRISQLHSKPSVPGRPLISASMGPMSLEVDTLATVMKHLTTSLTYDRDPYIPPLPFRQFLYGGTTSKLTIGYYDYDGWFQVVPSVKRAVSEAREKLEAEGHTLVPWTPPRVPDAVCYFFGACTVDSGKYLLNLLNKDLTDPLIEPSTKLMAINPRLKKLIGTLAGPFSPRFSRFLTCFPLTTSDLRYIYEQIGLYRVEFIQQWKEANIDCLLCPPQVTPALPHEIPMKVLPTVSYTALFNLLDFPAGVVPVTHVTAEDEKRTADEYIPNDFLDRIIKRANTSGTVGLPVGVQCVALPYEEEICLRLMREVEKAVAADSVHSDDENGKGSEGSYEKLTDATS